MAVQCGPLRLGKRHPRIRKELFYRERLRVAEMGVQCRHKRGALLDDPHACMTVPVNPAFMSFGAAEEAFQVEVVVRQVWIVATDKQARRPSSDPAAPA